MEEITKDPMSQIHDIVKRSLGELGISDITEEGMERFTKWVMDFSKITFGLPPETENEKIAEALIISGLENLGGLEELVLEAILEYAEEEMKEEGVI